MTERAAVGLGHEPTTERGRRTRGALVAAARVVFERDGYADSRLVDIAAEAGCSVGTFYTWFDGKDEVFAAVLEQAQADMLNPGTGEIAPADDPVAIIRASNRAYVEAHLRNGRLNQLLAQVATLDARFLDLRRRRTEAFVERNARAIADLQARGLADPELDKAFLAGAEAAGMTNLKGHRSVGGMRASIYNAMPLEGVQALIDYMKEFERTNA